MRSDRCGALRRADADREVVLCGWVHSRRDHGGVTFIDLRDAYGVVQIVFSPEVSGATHEAAQSLRSEYCIRVTGTVRARREGTLNDKLATGEIEVAADRLEVLSESETPPFQIDDHQDPDEMLRLRYRYLDLRRQHMQENLRLRHTIISSIRRFFDEEGFVEVETPMLTRATPEGARDYLVPSRLHAGSFYALPQSPQLFKQLLMVSGLDRYYQIARCFRDEDLRADRQPDFTQLDMEMSFVDVNDVLDVGERMFRRVWSDALGVNLAPFARLTYTESMTRFGTDKPDLRFGMELVDLAGTFAETELRVFRSVIDGGGAIKAIVVQGRADLARKELDAIVDDAKSLGAGGLVWIAVTPEGLRSPIEKFLSDRERSELVAASQAETGDLILVIADVKDSVVAKVLDALRRNLAHRFGLIPERDRSDPEAWKFAWIVDFPWFEYDE
nr:aspartate--tRNA ligase [Actinomycetota bacterium]